MNSYTLILTIFLNLFLFFYFYKFNYVDWDNREDIKATLKVDLILLLDKNGYPPEFNDEVFSEVFEQAENFKKYA
ncbi:protein of unknown function [Methanobrevibacter olleyae]|uniref:Type I restriction enzyme HindI endonuclease subunit-like C-terminal domain-containing protein n=1 Tax=Methanobrevibacter olleyae TaxID=294671 RepID=A0A1I4G2B6_METOL|nr:type I restriction enzyme endonuclease domain-containing protein [Methanobrevibacter olleyae]SFL23357.1 protein of unknown function [Methanobrevibacter olleyae]